MLKDILAISGQPGLFKMVSKGNNSVIVESLITGKRLPVYSSSKITSLEDIAIFTNSGETPLKGVFRNILANDQLIDSVDAKSSPADLKKFFVQVLPDYDDIKVYVSDIKKVVMWYKLLKEKDLLNLIDEPEEAEPDSEKSENKE